MSTIPLLRNGGGLQHARQTFRRVMTRATCQKTRVRLSKLTPTPPALVSSATCALTQAVQNRPATRFPHWRAGLMNMNGPPALPNTARCVPLWIVSDRMCRFKMPRRDASLWSRGEGRPPRTLIAANGRRKEPRPPGFLQASSNRISQRCSYKAARNASDQTVHPDGHPTTLWPVNKLPTQ